MTFNWTAERIESLKDMWDEQFLSSTAIAKHFGEGLSRNAVIGKVHRLGLKGRDRNCHVVSKPREPRIVKKRFGFRASVSEGRIAPIVREPMPEPPRLSPVGERTNIMMLSDKTCRWPIGDPSDRENFHYCGHAPKPDSVYCPYHHRVSYEPIEERRRRNRTAQGQALSRT